MRKRIPLQARVSFSGFFGKKHLALVLALSIMLLPVAFGQTTGSAAANPVPSPTAPSIEWQRTFSEGDSSYVSSMIQTSDRGWALTGTSMFIVAGDIGPWAIKFDSAGNQQWSQPYYDGMNTNLGGACSIVQTADGGYALAGSSYNNGTYLVKTDSQGSIQWTQYYHGENDSEALVKTADGGYAMAGTNSGSFWLAKVDSTGTLQWSHSYAAGKDGECRSMVQTSDGGYVLAGFEDTSGSESSAFLIKTDSSGDMLWTQTYPGSSVGFQAFSLAETNDGGFVLAGGAGDVCMIKTDSEGNVLWNQTYVGTSGEVAMSVIQTSDGGYALGCGWFGPSTGHLLKTDSNGNIQWNITLDDTVCSVVQTSAGAYVFAGGNFVDYDFLMGTNGSLTSPEPTDLQTPAPTVTSSQPPSNASQTTPTQSPASTLSSSANSKNGEATSFEGYLILAVALTVLVLVLTVITIILRRSNHSAITADAPLRRLSEL